ncbi:transposase (plasmid) [Bacillus mycoides]|nr:transposase [Bacillus mycoides]
MVLSLLSRQCKKNTFLMWNVTLYLKGYFNGKKRTTFQKYAETFKLKAVHLYKNDGRSYDAIAKELRMPIVTPLKMWVKQIPNGNALSPYSLIQ